MTWDPKILQAASVPLESEEPFFLDAWEAEISKLLFGEAGRVEYRLQQQKEKA